MRSELRALIVERRWYMLGLIATVGLQFSGEWAMRIALFGYAVVWGAVVYGITQFIDGNNADSNCTWAEGYLLELMAWVAFGSRSAEVVP